MFTQIYQPLWLTLSKETRAHLEKVFGIIPTGVREIRDQTIVSDGFTNKDLEVITTEKMAEYVGSTESFNRLWELTLAKVHYELHPPQFEITEGMVAKEIGDRDFTIVTPPPLPPRFCLVCDAEGPIKHKKYCSHYGKTIENKSDEGSN